MKKILIIIFIFFLFLNFLPEKTRSFFYNISSPIQTFFWQQGQDFFSFSETIFKISSFKERMEELQKENRKLKLENIFLQELEKENKVLKEALDIKLNDQFRLDLARILSRKNNYLLINKSAEEDSLLITEDKVLVGKVVESFSNQSKVKIITHSNSSFNAEILEKNISGLLNGTKLDLIPSDKNVEKGDIVTSKEFLIGKVVKVIKKDVEPFLTIEVEPAFNIRKLNYLFIIND